MTQIVGNPSARKRTEEVIANFRGVAACVGPTGVGKFSFSKSVCQNSQIELTVLNHESKTDEIKDVLRGLNYHSGRQVIVFNDFDKFDETHTDLLLKPFEESTGNVLFLCIFQHLDGLGETIRSRIRQYIQWERIDFNILKDVFPGLDEDIFIGSYSLSNDFFSNRSLQALHLSLIDKSWALKVLDLRLSEFKDISDSEKECLLRIVHHSARKHNSKELFSLFDSLRDSDFEIPKTIEACACKRLLT